MEISFWGVRGSLPNPDPSNQAFGANTTCIETRMGDGDLLIFDAGTGIASLGRSLPESGCCHIFISHGHPDHYSGLPFFRPFHNPKWKIYLHLPSWLSDLPNRLFDGQTFPLTLSMLQADLSISLHGPRSNFQLVGENGEVINVKTMPCNHPGRGLAFKVYTDEAVFAYSGDHEICVGSASGRELAENLLKDADVAVVDAAYNRDDYRIGWGHSTWEDWVEIAREHMHGTLFLSHHDLGRQDADLFKLEAELAALDSGPVRVMLARESLHFSTDTVAGGHGPSSVWLDELRKSLSAYKEESIILDRILQKSRELTNSEAGTVYLVEQDDLVFAYAHNDFLFPADSAHKHSYVNLRLPISTSSITGYVASMLGVLNIPDVYQLPSSVPYSFNSAFDEKTGYRTCSTLTVPIVGRDNYLLGVLQLINSLGADGRPVPFTRSMEKMAGLLAHEAASVLEGSNSVKNTIKRLMQIASLHDPTETGPHAERVGAVAAEVYQHWARKHEVQIEEIRLYKGQLRLAAMLHDIGKVGVSDLVLKKPGKLNDEEFEIMRRHTVLGAGLFTEDRNDISELARDAALHHHQRWDGRGYPKLESGLLAGEQIPLAARITAIADVYDALVSPRCYKKPWTVEEAEAQLQKESGTAFDPELVACFFEIRDTVADIYQRYPDSELAECGF